MAVEAGARSPLSRDRVLEAALRLADESGIEAVTMRRLGRALGVEAMSLYNHVANKDDVLGGILDVVLDETELPSAEGDWAGAIRRSAISVHQALRRHPWASALMLSADVVRPARLRHMDSLLARLRQAGLSAETTYHAYHVLDGHIFGFSLWQATHSFAGTDLPSMASNFLETLPADAYPYLVEHIGQHIAEGAHHDVSAFEFGLDLILEGLQKSQARGSS